MYKLSDTHSKHLLTQPETGMGYQVIEITKNYGEPIRGIAYNAELLSTRPIKEELLYSDYVAMLRGAKGFLDGEIRRVSVISRKTLLEEASYQGFADSLGLKKQDAGAANAPDEETRYGEKFKRFTAYANDKRITSGRGLVPGTYATTEEDARNVHNGKEAVARYALPNPKPAVFVFTISPLEKTKIRRGIVQPAFGQPGGGAEVLFVDGSSDNTVTGPDQIPEG